MSTTTTPEDTTVAGTAVADWGTPARAYEEYSGPAIFAPMARHTVDLVSPRIGETVLDLACGTGIVARRVAPMVAPGRRCRRAVAPG